MNTSLSVGAPPVWITTPDDYFISLVEHSALGVAVTEKDVSVIIRVRTYEYISEFIAYC